MTEKLLPCPFCGGEAIYESHDKLGFQRIRCTGCAVKTGYYAVNHGGNPAIDWNRRAPSGSAGETS